jgi:sporulation protein YlmC with PRC-barrel domain
MKTSHLTMIAAGLVWLVAGPVAAQQPTGGSAQPGGTPTAPAPPAAAPVAEPPGSGPKAQPSATGTLPKAQTQVQPQVQVDANSIGGSTVRGSDGRDVGKVDRLMVDPKDGRISTLVITMGGTLGIGGRNVSVPWQSVRLGQDQGRLVVTVDQRFLELAPAASPPSERPPQQRQ